MSVTLAENRYGKSRVRLVKVERTGSRHRVRDLSLDIQLSGDFDAAYVEGDNRRVLPTDTMKNTVYALARQHTLGEIEEFGQRVASHFLSRNAHVSEARVALSESGWKRIRVSGKDHDHAFMRTGGAHNTAVICHGRSGVTVKAGVTDLVVLKTAGSRFEAFLHDEYTTLKDASERLLGTAIRAEWTYMAGDHDYEACRHTAREAILEVFACHESASVQHTLYAVGEALLDRIPALTRVELSMPNRHCMLVNLEPFGLDNPNEVFVPTDDPYGVIEAVLTRS